MQEQMNLFQRSFGNFGRPILPRQVIGGIAFAAFSRQFGISKESHCITHEQATSHCEFHKNQGVSPEVTVRLTEVIGRVDDERERAPKGLEVRLH